MSDLTPSTQSLSIFQLESELAELMDFRDSEELSAEERQAVDGQIAEYLKRELVKVDNLRSYMRHCSIMADAAKAESELQAKRANSWKNRLEYLKGCCLGAMEIMGKKRLEGRTGYLLAKGNGGLQALTVYDDRLLPSNCRVAVIRVNLAEWERFAADCNEMSKSMQVSLSRLMTSAGWQSNIEADQKIIRAAMGLSCVQCGGLGTQCPAGPSDAPLETCSGCDGTGKTRVPGARLEIRGQHIEVK